MNNDWTVYPNPSTGDLFVKCAVADVAAYVSILTIDGRIIKQHPTVPSNTIWKIDVSQLPSANYFLLIRDNKGSVLYRLKI